MTSQGKNSTMTRPLFAIMAIVLISYVVLTMAISGLGLFSSVAGAVIGGAILLSLACAPLIYFLVLMPMAQAVQHAQAAQAKPQASNAEPRHPVHLDPLTQVLNHRAITVDLLESIAHSERYGNPLTLALVDVDNLKGINEDYGNEAGDLVLQMVAATLADALRMPDRIGRYVNGEFLLVLPETEMEDASTITDRVRAKISNSPIESEKGVCNATVSIGLTEYSKGDDIEAMVSRAIAALKEAKENGSNMVVTRSK